MIRRSFWFEFTLLALVIVIFGLPSWLSAENPIDNPDPFNEETQTEIIPPDVQSSGENLAAQPQLISDEKTVSYTVKGGDSLWAIASRFYGDGGRWSEIFKANSGLLANPSLIFPGMVLSIPDLSGGSGISGPSGRGEGDETGESSVTPDSSQERTPDNPGVLEVSKIYQGGLDTPIKWSACGPTSLAMCLRYFGVVVSAEELIGPCGTTGDAGSTHGGIKNAAIEYGFPDAHWVYGEGLSWLREQIAGGNPVLVNTSEYSGHYMVVKGFDAEGNIIANDPAKSFVERTYSPEVFLGMWRYNNASFVLK